MTSKGLTAAPTGGHNLQIDGNDVLYENIDGSQTQTVKAKIDTKLF